MKIEKKAKVKAATAHQSKPKSWHVFVGRHDPSITADDVKGYLEDASFVDIEVRPLEEKEKWQKKYAAFRVAINIKEKDIIFRGVHLAGRCNSS